MPEPRVFQNGYAAFHLLCISLQLSSRFPLEKHRQSHSNQHLRPFLIWSGNCNIGAKITFGVRLDARSGAAIPQVGFGETIK